MSYCQPDDLSCTFELSMCGWTSDIKMEVEWVRVKGPTRSKDTGPPGDTSGGK